MRSHASLIFSALLACWPAALADETGLPAADALVWIVLPAVLVMTGSLLLWMRGRTSARHGTEAATAATVPPSSASRVLASRSNAAPASAMRLYFRKMRGTTRGSPPRVSTSEILWSWVGSFLGIGAIALLNQRFLAGADLTLVIGSLGASAVLVYGAPRSPLAQPRNLVGGHVLSAAVGVATWKLLQQDPWLAQAVAVSTAIALMHATKTLHPPGGATALIAVIGSKQIHDLGFFYCLVPAALSPIILLVIGLLVNNLPQSRRYPESWI